jgi:hypothetical protein
MSLASATGAWAAVEVRQMTDDTITPDNTLNCSANPLPNPTVEQSYYRRPFASRRSLPGRRYFSPT